MEAGQLGSACSTLPRVLAAAAIVGLGAVGDAVEVGGQARGHGEVELAEELIAVFAVQLQGEGAEGAGCRGWRCRLRGSG